MRVNTYSAKRTTVTREEVLAAIPGSKGLIQPIEIALGCTRAAIKEILAKNPDVNQELSDEAEREKDNIIERLMADALGGDIKARELYLKAQCRDRGYGDKQETDADKNTPLVFLHAVASDLTANEKNGNAPKSSRIENWGKKAAAYHEEQIEDAKRKFAPGTELPGVRK